MKDKNTSPLGVLLITIATIIITLFISSKFNKPNTINTINTITKVKTQFDTIIKKERFSDTLFINKYIVSKIYIERNDTMLKQKFDVSDSILQLQIFTIAKDTVTDISIKYDLTIPHTTITKTDSIFIDKTITIVDNESKDKLIKLKAKQPLRVISSFLVGAGSVLIYNIINKK